MHKIKSPDGKNLVFWLCDIHKMPYPNNMCDAKCTQTPKIPTHLFYELILDEEGKRSKGDEFEAWMIEVKGKNGEWRLHALYSNEPKWAYDVKEPELRVVTLHRGVVVK